MSQLRYPKYYILLVASFVFVFTSILAGRNSIKIKRKTSGIDGLLPVRDPVEAKGPLPESGTSCLHEELSLTGSEVTLVICPYFNVTINKANNHFEELDEWDMPATHWKPHKLISGIWKGWEIDESSMYRYMVYNDGDICEGGKDRMLTRVEVISDQSGDLGVKEIRYENECELYVKLKGFLNDSQLHASDGLTSPGVIGLRKQVIDTNFPGIIEQDGNDEVSDTNTTEEEKIIIESESIPPAGKCDVSELIHSTKQLIIKIEEMRTALLDASENADSLFVTNMYKSTLSATKTTSSILEQILTLSNLFLDLKEDML